MTDIRNRFRSESSMDIYDEFKIEEQRQYKEYDDAGLYQDDHNFQARMVLANTVGLAQAIIASRNSEIELLKEELAYSNSRYIRKSEYVREQLEKISDSKARRI